MIDDEWIARNIDPELQKWLRKTPPIGFGVVYIGMRKIGQRRKGYVGKHYGTTSAWTARVMNHVRGKKAKQTAIHSAILKYGRGAFEWHIVCLVPVHQLNDAEISCIADAGTFAPHGYNVTKGGDGGALVGEALERMKATIKQPAVVEVKQEVMRKAWASKTTAERDAWGNAVADGMNSRPESLRIQWAANISSGMTPEAIQRNREGAMRAKGLKRKVRNEQARLEYKGFEPDKSKRIKDAYYLGEKGASIFRWDGKQLQAVCPLVDVDPGSLPPPRWSKK